MHLTITFYEKAFSKGVLTEGTVLFGPFILQIDLLANDSMSVM